MIRNFPGCVGCLSSCRSTSWGDWTLPQVARRVHADLQTIRRALQLDVPAYLVVSRMEQVPGFIEFARLRGPHEARQGRWGVSLPRRGDDGDMAWRSLVDFRFRVRRRTIDLVVRDLLDHDRNARLQGLDRTLVLADRAVRR